MDLFRPKNLLIIAFTQYLLQYFVLRPSFAEIGVSPLLGHGQFFFLVLDTVLIALGGFIINDVLDVKTDQVNKPKKVTVGKKWSAKMAIGLYVLLNLIGLEIAHSLALQLDNIGLMFIYPAAVLILYLYSKKLKATPLLGNILVAVFCAGVAGIVLFAEREIFIELKKSQPIFFSSITWLFGGYMIFAFLTTLFREIIKDIEDIEGDRKTGQSTFPVVFGITLAKKIAQVVNIILLISTLVFSIWLWKKNEWIGLILLISMILTPSVIQSIKLQSAEIKSDYSTISSNEKWIMLAGLALLLFL